METVVLKFNQKQNMIQAVHALWDEKMSYVVVSDFPIQEVEDKVQVRPVAPYFFIGGLFGGLGIYALSLYSSYDYPLNVGGQPLHHPGFIPGIYVITILFATLVGVLGFLISAKLLKYDSTRWQEKWRSHVEHGSFILRAECKPEKLPRLVEIVNSTQAKVLEASHD